MDNRLEFGSAFSRVFDLYGKHAAPLLMWAAAVQLVMSLLVAVLMAVVFGGGGIGATLAVGAVLAGVGVVASAVLSGAYVVGLHEVERGGSFPGVGEVWPKVAPRVGALVFTSILAGVGIAVGMLLLIVPGLVLLTWWAVIAPVVMLEDTSGAAALGRSRELVRGSGWTVFGLIVVTYLLTAIGSNVIGGIVGAILGGADSMLGAFGGNFVSGTLLAPISALLAVVIYHGLIAAGDGADPRDTTPPAVERPAARPADEPGSGPFV